MLARKLATRNWFAIARFPPSRSMIIGAAVTGGTALCNIRIKAIEYPGLIKTSRPRTIPGKTKFLNAKNLRVSVIKTFSVFLKSRNIFPPRTIISKGTAIWPVRFIPDNTN
ncbi:MAG TPA: hypothetical protein VIS94_16380 [Desulfomonilia bacterium]